MNSVYVGTAIAAAMLNGFGFVLQQHAAEQVRSAKFLHLSLIARLIHNRRWLAGIGVVIAGNLLSAWTLGHLTLTVVEPLLTTNLIFALLLAVPLSGQALRRTEIVGAILLTAGVAALSLTRSVRSASESFGSFSHWPAAAAVIAVVTLCLVELGRRRTGWLRATLTGTASGLVLGIADALTRSSVQVLDGHNPLSLLTTWPGYATVVTALIGWWLMQSAFSVAPLHASLPAITAAEPAAGMVIGVLVFGDVVHISPLLIAVQAVAVAAMVGGVILVARAPVFRDLHLRELPHVALERLQHPPRDGTGEFSSNGANPADSRSPERGRPERGRPEHGRPEHGRPEHGGPEPREQDLPAAGSASAIRPPGPEASRLRPPASGAPVSAPPLSEPLASGTARRAAGG